MKTKNQTINSLPNPETNNKFSLSDFEKLSRSEKRLVIDNREIQLAHAYNYSIIELRRLREGIK